jgi:hypothetical protein
LASNSGAGGIDSSSTALPNDDRPRLSGFAQILSSLQQLQQSDPAKYQQVTAQIATNLQNAAKTATANGNTSQAAELNKLATDFTNASQNNTLPNIQDLAQAAHGAHGHHHHHAHAGSESSGSTSTDTIAGAATTNSGSTGASANDLSSIISAYLTNSTASAQTNSLDPFSIMRDTLINAGVAITQQ